MNLAALIERAFHWAPSSCRGTITFTDRSGNTAEGEAVGVPASGSPADSFQERAVTRERARRLSVLPGGLAFPPKAGMYADWEGIRWTVLAVSPLDPNGSGVPSLYRVTVSR